MRKAYAAAASLTPILLTAVFAAVVTQVNIDNNGDIYASPNLELSTYSFYWGSNLQPSQTVKQYVNMSNTGNVPTQPLQMTNTCAVGVLTWNLQDAVLQPNQTVLAVFTLKIHSEPEHGPFNFETTVIG